MDVKRNSSGKKRRLEGLARLELENMRPILLCLLAAMLFGLSTPLGKLLLTDWSPNQLAGMLYLGAAFGVAIPILLGKKGFFSGAMNPANGWRLAGSIIFGGILGPVFLLTGLKLASASSVSLWLNLEMVATALLATLFFRDHLGKFGWAGAACILGAGILLSVGESGAGLRAGFFLGLACLCWGMDNNLTSLIDGLHPLQSTFWKGLVAGIFNLALGFYLSPMQGSLASATGGMVVGAVSYGASIAFYISAAQGLGAVRSQLIFASSTLFGLLFSNILLKDPFQVNHTLSLLFQAVGLYLLFRDKHSHEHEHEVMEHVHTHSHADGHHQHEHAGAPASLRHSHAHSHGKMRHSHPHWPDLHHRHPH